jgi:hypothetical protein
MAPERTAPYGQYFAVDTTLPLASRIVLALPR